MIFRPFCGNISTEKEKIFFAASNGAAVSFFIHNEKATERITFRWLFALLIQIETLLEAINTSAGVYQLLLTREEGVALGANVNDDILLGGAGLNDIAAGTADRGLLVLGMDALFHVVSPLSTDMFTYLQQS